MTVRSRAKAIAEGLLVAAGAPAWSARRHRRGICILAYHNIVPDTLAGVGDVSLHLRASDFRQQLDQIGRQYDVVPLREAMDETAPGGRPRVAITFDDAYLGAVTLGVEELARHGFAATIFVPPGLLGRHAMWWDSFVPHDPVAGQAPPMDVRNRALTECGGRDVRVRELAARSRWGGRALPDVALTASEDELADACRRHDGLSLGSHTWSHPNLTRSAPSELAEELRLPLEWLNRREERTIPWLAYPYGLANATVAQAARAAGYAGAVLVSGGWVAPPIRDPFAIPRVNIPAGVSAAGFALRVAGVLGSGAARM